MSAAHRLAPTPADLPFVFDEVAIDAGDRVCGALVMQPRTPTVFGARQRETLSAAPALSEVERRILAFMASRSARCPILLFRAVDASGERLWQFDPSFDDDELSATGRSFVEALLPFYRRVAAAGIVAFVHVDWHSRDVAPLRQGIADLAEDFDRDGDTSPLRALDAWIARNLLLYSSLSLRHVVERLLPTHVPMLARRKAKVDELLACVPPTELA